MSTWRGLRGKGGGKHEKYHGGFSGYGFDPNRLWLLLQFWVCVIYILNIQNAKINQHRETLQSVFKRLKLGKGNDVGYDRT